MLQQTYNEGDSLEERNDSTWKFLDAGKKENQCKKKNGWVNPHEYCHIKP